jgi:hypothetical protein
MSQVANDYLMRRYPSRRKACRDPLENSVVGGGGCINLITATKNQQNLQQNNNFKKLSNYQPIPPLNNINLSSTILNAPYSALSENFVLATN